jgi:hypothetical protein
MYYCLLHTEHNYVFSLQRERCVIFSNIHYSSMLPVCAVFCRRFLQVIPWEKLANNKEDLHSGKSVRVTNTRGKQMILPVLSRNTIHSIALAMINRQQYNCIRCICSAESSALGTLLTIIDAHIANTIEIVPMSNLSLQSSKY